MIEDAAVDDVSMDDCRTGDEDEDLWIFPLIKIFWLYLLDTQKIRLKAIIWMQSIMMPPMIQGMEYLKHSSTESDFLLFKSAVDDEDEDDDDLLLLVNSDADET